MPKCYEQFKAAALTDKVILECLYIGVGFSRLDDVGVIPAFPCLLFDPDGAEYLLSVIYTITVPAAV